MKIDDVIKLDIIAYDHEGIGIARLDDKTIFVEKTVIGEEVLAKIEYMSTRVIKAKLLEVLRPSNNRNMTPCKYTDKCGGCNIFHMNYDEQLRFKKQMVIDTLYKVGHIETEVDDVRPNPNKLHYRNKIIVPLGVENGEIISGFYEAKSHNIVPQTECLIENEYAKVIIKDIKDLLKEYKISIYDEISHSGIARNIMIRVNDHNEFMIILITTVMNEKLKNLMIHLLDTHKCIKSIYINVNDKKTNVILNQDGFIHIAGNKTLIETINDLKFEVHPNSFLQVNHDQAEALYNKALDYVPDNKNQVIIDAYCGIGSITLNLASKAKEVYGIEVVEEAIINANINKKINSISNAHFICGKCENEIVRLKNLKNVDMIVFDPPRKGCDTKFLDTVISMNIKKIVYISCLTSTFARDARYLMDNGYKLVRVHPFDLFSHSSHTENLGYFEKIK